VREWVGIRGSGHTNFVETFSRPRTFNPTQVEETMAKTPRSVTLGHPVKEKLSRLTRVGAMSSRMLSVTAPEAYSRCKRPFTTRNTDPQHTLHIIVRLLNFFPLTFTISLIFRTTNGLGIITEIFCNTENWHNSLGS
jgi:hypothetical protein